MSRQPGLLTAKEFAALHAEGVRLVWVVYRIRRTVEIFQRHRQMLLVTEQEQLTGIDVVPGFFAPVAEIFAE